MTSTSNRREHALRIIADCDCEHTSNIAYDLNCHRNTVRADLDWLEAHGFIEGTKHNERDLLPNGRVRIYWSLTAKGQEHVEAMKKGPR